MKAEICKITYAHCIKYTPGQLDVAPFSAYQLRQAEVSFWAVSFNGEDEFICKDASGRIIGEGDTLKGCQDDASYILMAESREMLEGQR